MKQFCRVQCALTSNSFIENADRSLGHKVLALVSGQFEAPTRRAQIEPRICTAHQSAAVVCQRRRNGWNRWRRRKANDNGSQSIGDLRDCSEFAREEVVPVARSLSHATRCFPRQKCKWVLPLPGVGVEDRAGATRRAPIWSVGTMPFNVRQAAILDLEATTSELCEKVSLVRCTTNESRAAMLPRLPHVSLVRSQRERVRCVQRRPLRRIVPNIVTAAHWQPLAPGQWLH